MKNKLTLLFVLSPILFFSPGCDDDNDKHCTYPKSIEELSGCYDPTLGLTLTASGTEAEGKNYLWALWVLKEKTDGISESDAKTTYGGLAITLKDTQLLDNEQVVARIAVNCEGEELKSMYFKFFKEKTGSCFTWIPEH